MNLPSKTLTIEVAHAGTKYVIKWTAYTERVGGSDRADSGILTLNSAEELMAWLANAAAKLT